MIVGFVTCTDRPGLAAGDVPAAEALRRLEIDVAPVAWDGPEDAWRACRLLVIRSTWNYQEQPDRFAAWIDAVAASGIPIWNPPRLLRWNMHKAYLRDLADRGLPVVPTRVVPRGSAAGLASILDDLGTREAVVKPAISASGWRTWRIAGDGAAASARFAVSLDEADLIVQPFVAEIAAGEWSLIFVDGEYTHAVLKTAAVGEFRVQEEFGGRAHRVDPPAGLHALARRTLERLDAAPLYARIDLVDRAGGPILMEAELIEPQLFFPLHPPAALRFAQACRARLSGVPDPRGGPPGEDPRGAGHPGRG